MQTIPFKWLTAMLLGLGLCLLVTPVGAEDDAQKEAAAAAQKDVLKLVGKVGDANFAKQTEQLAKKHKLEPVMIQLRTKAKGGVGIGGLINAEHRDSIEILLRDYSAKPPTQGEVTKYANDIVKAGEVAAIVAEVTVRNTPTAAAPKKDPKDWKRLAEEMQKGSADLIAAGKAKDEKAVAAAAKRLNASCVDCHAIFREAMP